MLLPGFGEAAETQQQLELTTFVNDTVTGVGASKGIQPVPCCWELTSVASGRPLPTSSTHILASDLHQLFPLST